MFQSTLPRGERLILGVFASVAQYVSIHAPTWGATLQTWRKNTISGFQSTLPRGERLQSHQEWNQIIGVSIHAPTWGATLQRYGFLLTYASFNPRSHVGSDRASGAHTEDRTVSIHAPTWGATGLASGEWWREARFNPRSHVGSDLARDVEFTFRVMFQSTLPRGERLFCPSGTWELWIMFQSTLPRGERLELLAF